MSELAENYYSTTHLALAATISLYYPLESIDRNNPHKAKFQFKKDKKLDELVDAFWKNELQVNPLAFFNQIKELKTRIYEGDL